MTPSYIQDTLFVIGLLALMAVIVLFLYKAVRAGYRRAMIEHMQNMSESTRQKDNTEVVELEDIPSNTEGQKPYIGVYKVHMLAPNTAQYGKRYATYVPSVAGIPLSAFPDIDMRNPWSLSDIEAAEVPEREGCRKSATGLFHECGVPPANMCG